MNLIFRLIYVKGVIWARGSGVVKPQDVIAAVEQGRLK